MKDGSSWHAESQRHAYSLAMAKVWWRTPAKCMLHGKASHQVCSNVHHGRRPTFKFSPNVHSGRIAPTLTLMQAVERGGEVWEGQVKAIQGALKKLSPDLSFDERFLVGIVERHGKINTRVGIGGTCGCGWHVWVLLVCVGADGASGCWW